MIPFTLNILGSGSAVPTLHRNPSSQLLQYNGLYFLIDCAEGTQLQLKKMKVSAMRIGHILISHLHGDHYFGLIGLLTSLHLMGRTSPLYVYGPPQLIDIINLQLGAAQTKLNYPLLFSGFEQVDSATLFEDENIQVRAFPLLHRIPTWGFLFGEKPGERRIHKDFIARYSPAIETIKAIKDGADFELHDGSKLPNSEITTAPHPPRSYAYCTDTAFNENIVPLIRNVTVLYHEATFMQNRLQDALKTFHSTSVQAAQIAKMANAGTLLLGHYSSRYKDLEPLLREAKLIFDETYAADDGFVMNIK
jgi:ribonuclease Z